MNLVKLATWSQPRWSQLSCALLWMWGASRLPWQDWGYFSYELLLLCTCLSLAFSVGLDSTATGPKTDASDKTCPSRSFCWFCPPGPGRHLLREGPALDQVANLIPICRVRAECPAVNVVHPTVNHPQNHHKTGAINHSQMVGLLLGLPHQSL